MLDSTKVALMRLGCGTALLITAAVFKVDSTLTAISLFLLGVPVEYIEATREKK